MNDSTLLSQLMDHLPDAIFFKDGDCRERPRKCIRIFSGFKRINEDLVLVHVRHIKLVLAECEIECSRTKRRAEGDGFLQLKYWGYLIGREVHLVEKLTKWVWLVNLYVQRIMTSINLRF